MSKRAPDERVAVAKSVPMLLVHVAALGVFFVPFHWSYAATAVGLYALRMFFITAGYHRYFGHRAFKTSRAFQFVLALGGATAAQKGALWWAGHHRHHHRFSDEANDIHSPLQKGFWWSHVGWVLSTKYDATPTAAIKDFAKFPELRWLDRHHLVPPVALGALLFALGGVGLLLWGFVVSTVLLWHGTFTINSLSHVFGSRRYATTDTSKNNWLLAVITLGEGWHNNHHFYQSTANQGWFWWEVDVSYYVLRGLAALGLVWELRTPPAHIKSAHEQATAPALDAAA